MACRIPEGRLMVKRAPTRRQLEVLRAYVRAGSIAAAAHELGIGETTVRQHLSGLYRRTGCLNAAQAAYWLGCGQLAGHSAAWVAGALRQGGPHDQDVGGRRSPGG
jgi:DNA-binding CsgD family transcriptional regulator